MHRLSLITGVLALWLPAAALGAQGSASVSEDRFLVQEKVSFDFDYVVGPGGFGQGDEVRVHDPEFHGMRWSKWGDLSPWPTDCTEASVAQRASWGFVRGEAWRADALLGDVAVGVERSNCSAENQRCRADIHEAAWTSLFLSGGGPLQEGDVLRLKVGDVVGCAEECAAQGAGDCSHCDDCGFETPDRSFREVAWASEECLGDGACEPLSPVLLEFGAAPQVALVHAEVPSQALVGQAFPFKIALLDRWGNASAAARRTVTVGLAGADGEGDGLSHEYQPTDEGWHDFSVRLDTPGVYRLQATDDTGETVLSNPVEVFEAMPTHQIFWGDLHVHHGYSFVDSDGMSDDINHAYARDVIGLDVVAESVKAAGIEIKEDALWTELQANCAAYTVDDAYLVLLAFEWIGDVASGELGTETEGHHNVYYDACEAPYGTHDTSVVDGVGGATGLFEWVTAVQADHGVQAVTVPHATRFTGHNFDVSAPQLQTLVEVYSEWGDSTTWREGDGGNVTADGSTQDLLNSGHRLGWIAASDNHDGWMGNPFSTKSVESGLGAFLATELRRASVFEAMQQRRSYATTGHRPILHFWVQEGTDRHAEQGQEVLAQSPSLHWRVHGTAEIAQIQIWAVDIEEDAEQAALQVSAPASWDVADASVAVPWDGQTDVAVWLEMTQTDGERAWSSPIWLTADCGRLSAGALDPLGICDDWVPPDSGVVEPGDTGEAPAVRCGCSAGGTAWLWVVPFWLLGRRRKCEDTDDAPRPGSAGATRSIRHIRS